MFCIDYLWQWRQHKKNIVLLFQLFLWFHFYLVLEKVNIFSVYIFWNDIALYIFVCSINSLLYLSILLNMSVSICLPIWSFICLPVSYIILCTHSFTCWTILVPTYIFVWLFWCFCFHDDHMLLWILNVPSVWPLNNSMSCIDGCPSFKKNKRIVIYRMLENKRI